MVSVPYQYIDATGVIVPDTSAILTDVQNEYKAALGPDLVVTADTPQGALITAEALARNGVVNNNAALANKINPNVADGVFLDAILALMGVERTPASPSVVKGVTLSGVAGTIIPAGTQARTSVGDVFQTTGIVQLGVGGTTTVDFQSVENGPIPCDVGALTTIVTNVLGWESVTNSNAAILGAALMSDQAARAYRQNTLGFQGVSIAECITSALYAVNGVTSLTFQENTADTTQTINGISMVSHSIYACVYGGLDLDVAAALLENKSAGCAFVGGTTVNVVEPASNQTYAVKFDRPTVKPIVVRVTTPNGITGDIQQAVLNYAAGLINGLPGLVVGGDVSPFEIAGAITAQYPSYFISKVEVSLASSISWSTNTLVIAVNEIATISLSNITVVIA